MFLFHVIIELDQAPESKEDELKLAYDITSEPVIRADSEAIFPVRLSVKPTALEYFVLVTQASNAKQHAEQLAAQTAYRQLRKAKSDFTPASVSADVVADALLRTLIADFKNGDGFHFNVELMINVQVALIQHISLCTKLIEVLNNPSNNTVTKLSAEELQRIRLSEAKTTVQKIDLLLEDALAESPIFSAEEIVIGQLSDESSMSILYILSCHSSVYFEATAKILARILCRFSMTKAGDTVCTFDINDFFANDTQHSWEPPFQLTQYLQKCESDDIVLITNLNAMPDFNKSEKLLFLDFVERLLNRKQHVIFTGDLAQPKRMLEEALDELSDVAMTRIIDTSSIFVDEGVLIQRLFQAENIEVESPEALYTAFERFRIAQGGRAIEHTLLRFFHQTRVALLSTANPHLLTADVLRRNQRAETVESQADTVNSVLDEINAMVGLADVKLEFEKIAASAMIAKRRLELGIPVCTSWANVAFTGNPGTGKTTVAACLARLYKALGFLNEGRLITANRSSMVAKYDGQSSHRTLDLLRSAKGSCLLLDEAYALILDEEHDVMGHEALSALTQYLSENVGESLLIFCGYDKPMQRFFDANPGLRSRVSTVIHFSDYSATELVQIFSTMCSKSGFSIAEEATPIVRDLFDRAVANKTESFGNARYAEQYFQKTRMAQELRLARLFRSTQVPPTAVELTTLLCEDCRAGIKALSAMTAAKEQTRHIGFSPYYTPQEREG